MQIVKDWMKQLLLLGKKLAAKKSVKEHISHPPQTTATQEPGYFVFNLPSFTQLTENSNFHFGVVGACVLLICVLIVIHHIQSTSLSQDPAAIAKRNLQNLTQAVGKQIQLPTNESPVSATVTDATALPHEKFFAKAQNGDKILMYKGNKLAILYRPSTGKIIASAVLDYEDAATPTPNPASAVAGASTSATTGTEDIPQTSPVQQKPYVPQGKILVLPNQ